MKLHLFADCVLQPLACVTTLHWVVLWHSEGELSGESVQSDFSNSWGNARERSGAAWDFLPPHRLI